MLAGAGHGRATLLGGEQAVGAGELAGGGLVVERAEPQHWDDFDH